MRAARKVETIREDLGKVGPVIAQQVEEARLGRNVRLDTAAAERDSEPVRRLLKFNIKVTEQIERLREQFQETKRSLRLSPENVRSVVAIGLELAGQPALIELKRNLSSLRARVEQIRRRLRWRPKPSGSRFRNPMPRLFPLAVTFLIPQKIAHGG